MRIIKGTLQNSEHLAARLWSAIEGIALGSSNKYSEVIKHPTLELWAVKIVESGRYWEAIKAELTQEELDSIETAGDEWREDRKSTN